MVVRQTRLIAGMLLATILMIAAGSILWLGWDHSFLVRRDHAGAAVLTLSAGQAAVKFGVWAVLWSFVFDRAARMRRWRRNILRAGGAFAISWIGTLTLILMVQVMAVAETLGHPVAQHRAYLAVIAILILAKANFLPKSRPAWFNGVTFPFVIADPQIWRQVHRWSAYRLSAIGGGALSVACLGPPEADMLPWVIRLLLVEICMASLHGLWLDRGRTRLEIV
jgi:hypothetical protein